MSRTTLSVNADGLRVAGTTAELDVSGGPLIVALHGGSYTGTYFDVPGHSLLTRAANNGIRVIALDRPCYGGSDALSADNVTFERSAKALDAAITRLWDDHGTHHTGVVLVGHSIGGAICIHIASQAPDWPLLGIAVSGIHDVAPKQVRKAWEAMPAGQPVEFTPEQRRMFFYGPEWTIESDIVSRADASAAPIPLAELLEVVGRWPDQAAALAAKVTVPVQIPRRRIRAPVVHRRGLRAQLRRVLHRRSTRRQRAADRDRTQRRPSPQQPGVPTSAARLRPGLRATHRPSRPHRGVISRLSGRRGAVIKASPMTDRRRRPRGRRD